MSPDKQSALDKQRKFSIRDMIYIIGFVVIILSNYFTTKNSMDLMKNDQENLKKEFAAEVAMLKQQVENNTNTINAHNYELIDYKLDIIMKKLGIDE